MDNDNGVKVEDMYIFIGGKTGHLYSEIITCKLIDFISKEVKSILINIKAGSCPSCLLLGGQKEQKCTLSYRNTTC
jgi:hypothetical protein